MNYNTTIISANNKQNWYIIDAESKFLGKLAVQITEIIRGKNKCFYSPHLDLGDYVIIVNAKKVKVSGKKNINKKYMFFSGWRGNEKYIKFSDMKIKDPKFIIFNAVKGMLPKNKLSYQIIKKLKIYEGENHPHVAQNPININ